MQEPEPDSLYSPGAEGRPQVGFRLEELKDMIREMLANPDNVASLQIDRKQQVREILNGKDPVEANNARISHPMHGFILFDTYDFQDTLLQDFNDYRFNIILKARQLGISITAGYITWLMLFHRDKSILVMATKFATAGNLVKKVKSIMKNLPEWSALQRFQLTTALHSSFLMVLIKAASTRRCWSFRGTVSLVLDEAAHIEGLEEL